MESKDRLENTAPSRKENDTSHAETRRRLIRGGLVGVPVLLALKSTPVLACNCKLPSGFSTSGNLSRNRGKTCTDPAKGPSWWPNQIGSNKKFNGTSIHKDTKFNSIFGGTDARSLLMVLKSGTTFASLVTAAYLDINAWRFVPGISADDIKKMWKGTYKPRFNMQPRSLAENENYLRYTMGLPLINH